MEDDDFFERAILAHAAGPDDEDATRRLRELFTDAEFVAWQESKRAASSVVVPVEHDDEGDRYLAEWGGFGIQGASPGSYEAAIDDLVPRVRAWARDLSESGAGATDEVAAVVDEVAALDDAALRDYLLVRVSFDRGGLTFRLAEFVEEDGTTTQRAVPFADGHPPAEIDLPVDGRMRTYQSSTRGDRVAFSPKGAGPSIADTLRQEEPTGDIGAEFPQPGFGPPRRHS